MYKALLLGVMAAIPSSSNFSLPAYDFGGGADSSSSSSYQLQGSAGAVGGTGVSGSYSLPAGIRASASVSTPAAPTFTNPDNSYNRLKITLNTAGFASDVKYLIAISSDNFATTNYVQTDQTVGPTANVTTYQTYATWGGASGFWVLGLNASTTYTVKVAALQGSATGSAFGPTSSVATSAPSVTFAVSTSATSTPPFAVNFGSLTPGLVVNGAATIGADITTNAQQGGSLLIRSQNGALTSTATGASISSATADISSQSSGYGAQVTGASQGSGGPITATSPFNGLSDNVGGLNANWQQLAGFTSSLTSGNITVALKAKSNAQTLAASDYSDVITLSVTLLF